MNYPRYVNTISEYIELEKSRDERFEYWDGAVFCLTHCSLAHKFIAGDIFFALSNAMKRKDDSEHRVMSGFMRIKTPLSPPYKYPDVVVALEKRRFETIETQDCLVNPTLIVEICSVESERINRGPKFSVYKAIPSFREYLLVSESESSITQYVKQPDDQWKCNVVTGLDATIYLPSIDCSLAFSEVYQEHKVKIINPSQ